MTQAQRQAFIDQCETGKRSTRRHQVYKVILESNHISLNGIHRALGDVQMATVSGRVSELLDMGLIKEWKSPIVINHHRQSAFKPVHDPEEQQQLSHERTRERYEKWVKLGHTAGFFDRYTADFWTE